MRGRSCAYLLLLLVPVASACASARGRSTASGPTVHSLTITGASHVDVARLESVLATRANPKVPILGWQLPWTRKNTFDRTRLDADVQRITAFYGDRGYPDARVANVDVKPNARETAVDVTISVEEGTPVRVAAVQLRGFDALPPRRLEQLERSNPVVSGAPRDRQLVASARDIALNTLRDEGYPYARVGVSEEPSGTDAVTVTLTSEPGPIAHFGEAQVSGNKTVGSNVITRQLLFKPGDLYRRSLVQESQRRLYGLELFQFVNIENLDADRAAPVVPTRVTVAEGKHHRVNFGVGYGSEEKARVDAEYRNLNFLGGGRSAGVHGRYSSLDRGLRLDATQPYFLAPHLSLSGEGQQWYTYTPAYRSTVTAAKLTLTHRETQRLSWAFSIGSERNSTAIEPDVLNDPDLYADLIALGLDPTTRTQSGTLSALGFDLQRNTTDNVLNAHHGTQISLHAEEAGRLLPGTYNYYALSADGRYYLPAGRTWVFASRLQVGVINAFGNSPAQVPFSKKYFLGGASSIRGWGRYEVSPLSRSGLPLGGNGLLQASLEARAALGGRLGGVLFVDGGNVWTSGREITVNDLRYAAGTGIRYDTPVGPIRVDVGYQLNPIPDLLIGGSPQPRRWRLHFSIGQAF
ncbi:MAG: BamA/TamA family outer membrane protein [Vicinamibacterales bacterium]